MGRKESNQSNKTFLAISNFCCLLITFSKLLGSRSGLAFCQSRSGYKLFDTLIVFLKEFLNRSIFKKKSVDHNRSIESYPAYKELKGLLCNLGVSLVRNSGYLTLKAPTTANLICFRLLK